ncbi:hypothetical protein EIP86_006206 [Pleurotus ostreatoroseus]|nr:hypothetical protein EIP86_006206 [Pleurotus ostreatoroseus]
MPEVEVTIKQLVSPISSLPLEIFLQVLRHYIASYWDGFDPGLEPEAHRRTYLWIRVTHVCRTWREAALQTPDLWTTIRACRLECVQFFLERSLYLPLRICILKRDKGAEECLPLLFQEAHRFRSIIFDRDASLSELVKPTYPWARAAVLIEVINGELWDDLQHYSLFNEELPSLRVLRCGSPSAALTSVLRRCLSLRVLDYTLADDRPGHFRYSPPTWIEWSRVLKELPLLEELALREAMSRSPLPLNSSPVRLPRLRRLVLKTDDSWYIGNLFASGDFPGEFILLAMLSLPSHTTIDICDGSPMARRILLQLVDGIQARFITTSASDYTSAAWSAAEQTVMYTCIESIMPVEYLVWHSQLQNTSQLRSDYERRDSRSIRPPVDPVTSLKLSIQVHWGDTPQAVNSIVLPVIGELFPLHYLKTFAFDSFPWTQYLNDKAYPLEYMEALKVFMEGMTDVETLMIGGHHMVESLSHILVGDPRLADVDTNADCGLQDTKTSGALTLPSLKHLCIGMGEPVSDRPAKLAAHLERILRRREGRHPIQVHICFSNQGPHLFRGPPNPEKRICWGEFHVFDPVARVLTLTHDQGGDKSKRRSASPDAGDDVSEDENENENEDDSEDEGESGGGDLES